MSESKIIQFSQLGRYGRFGNQMFQYAFARAYAEKYGAVLQIPPWIGERVFKNVSHPNCTCKLPTAMVNEVPPVGDNKVPWGRVNIDFCGYFNTKDCIDILSEAKVREWFTFQDEWLEIFPEEKGDAAVAHLRRGDYTAIHYGWFCSISKISYLQACEKYGIDKEKLIWITEENPTINSRSAEVCYSRFPGTMYGSANCYDDKGVGFLPDFFRMINAKVLLRANSTFSLWAGFFNKNKVYSPIVEGRVGMNDVEFAEGNWPRISNREDDFYLNP